MPMGQFADWESCIKHYTAKGYSKSKSERLCGKIKHLTEGKTFTNEELQQLESRVLTENWAEEILEKNS